jgi:hypothetical protein
VTDCVLWQGAVQSKGYALIYVDGKRMLLHRHVYETEVGPIPPGRQIHHVCGNTRCINPDHLVALSPGEHRAAHGQEYRKAHPRCRVCGADEWYAEGRGRKCAPCKRKRENERYAARVRGGDANGS